MKQPHELGISMLKTKENQTKPTNQPTNHPGIASSIKSPPSNSSEKSLQPQQLVERMPELVHPSQ